MVITMKRTTIYFDESKLNKLKEFSYRNKISTAFTFNRKHFYIYKPQNLKNLTLVP